MGPRVGKEEGKGEGTGVGNLSRYDGAKVEGDAVGASVGRDEG